jgi:ABC-type spermidine/putrescine transport system permease subunit I
MAHESQSEPATERSRLPPVKYLVVSYPALALVSLFAVPLLLLFVFSFFQNVSGGYLRYVLTFENYVRFFEEPLYLERLVFSLRLAAVTTIGSLLLGYPLAYRLATTDSSLLRRSVLMVVVSSLWLTFIIRGYAWAVLLRSNGLFPILASRLGITETPVSLVPGYWALVVSMVYVFLPFMVLTLYTSIKNVDHELREAARNLGAGPLTTFRHVTLPLTKDGIVSGSLLVFVLSMGVYVLPRILGNPPQWTLAVVIGNQVTVESNVPFGATLSIALMLVVVGLIAVTVRLTGVETFGVSATKEVDQS